MKKFSREELKSLILEIDNLWQGGNIGSIAFGSQSSRSSGSSKVDSDGTVTITPKDPSGKLNCLFVGDSQIYRAAHHGKTSFPHLLANEMSDKYNVEIRADNRRLLQQMDQSLSSIAGTNFDVITIFGGGNNGKRTGSDHEADKALYNKMYQKAKTSGIDTIVVAVTNPTKLYHPEGPEAWPSNDLLAEHVRTTTGYDILIDANQMFRSESDFSDGYHLSKRSHKKLRDVFDSKIKRASPPQNELKIRSLIRNKLLQF